MRLESCVTSVSWIPTEAIARSRQRLPFAISVANYDAPPPDHLNDVAALVDANRCRLANQLRAWIDVRDGVITDSGQTGRGYIAAVAFRVAGLHLQATPVRLPDQRRVYRIAETAVRFEQSIGGRIGLPGRPSWSRSALYWRVAAPLAWTTLALTMQADGTAECELVGASLFPRHWVYDGHGNLHSKSAAIDFKAWSASASFDAETPWGVENSAPVVRQLESALERELSVHIMERRTGVRTRRLPAGTTLTEQGERADDLYLLLDGLIRVEVNGKPVAEVGPGAILGERAGIEEGRRTATLRAVTPCNIAITSSAALSQDALRHLAEGHREEDRD